VKPCVTHMYSLPNSTPMHRRHTSTAAISPNCAVSVHLVNRLPHLIKRRQLRLKSMQSALARSSANLLKVEVPSIGGARYVLAVTDASTRNHWTAPLRLKSDETDKLFHIILSMPETHHPLTLRTDGVPVQGGVSGVRFCSHRC